MRIVPMIAAIALFVAVATAGYAWAGCQFVTCQTIGTTTTCMCY